MKTAVRFPQVSVFAMMLIAVMAFTISTDRAAMLSASNLLQGGTGYPLVCRGGGNLHFNYTPFSNISPNPQIWIRFERGASPAGANKENVGSLLPGQCAWLDRTIAPNEPETLVFAEPVFHGRQFAIQWQGGRVMGIASELTYINDLQRSDGIRTFRAYNNGNGFFIVSSIE